MSMPTHWLCEHELSLLCADTHSKDWLRERGSLTERLRRRWGDVTVQPLQEALVVPQPNEARCLALAPDAVAWVRCVLLAAQDRPRVYARSVVPHWSDSNPWADVQRLGQRPLGELLFRLPELERSGFEWAQGLAGRTATTGLPAFQQPGRGAACSPATARRCC